MTVEKSLRKGLVYGSLIASALGGMDNLSYMQREKDRLNYEKSPSGRLQDNELSLRMNNIDSILENLDDDLYVPESVNEKTGYIPGMSVFDELDLSDPNKVDSNKELIVSDSGVNIIKRLEGFRGHAYQCQSGVWTIGYGSTKGVRKGDRISRKDADQRFRKELQSYENFVKDNVDVPLTQDQFDALVSFTYNVGKPNFKRSELREKLNEGDYDAVPEEMKEWNKVGKKKRKSKGLVRRRNIESNLFVGE